jgi:hypothetical protein
VSYVAERSKLARLYSLTRSLPALDSPTSGKARTALIALRTSFRRFSWRRSTIQMASTDAIPTLLSSKGVCDEVVLLKTLS